MTKKTEISLLNCFLCLVVVFIHIVAQAISGLTVGSVQYIITFFPSRLCTFAVPGFVFLSGLKICLNHKDGLDVKKFYISRFFKIILPYIAAGIVYYVFFCIVGYVKFDISELVSGIATGRMVSHFYFIVVIAQFYLLMPFWLWFFKRVDAFAVLPAALLIMLLYGQSISEMISVIASMPVDIKSDNKFLTYIFYWVAGCYAGLKYESFKAMIIKNRYFIIGMFIFSAVVFTYFDFQAQIFEKWVTVLENIHIFYCISAVFGLFCISALLTEKKDFVFIYPLDKASYEIFLYHCLVIFIIDYFMHSAGIFNTGARLAIRFVFTYLICALICMALWKFPKLLRRR